jgi:hypothetical protein
MRHENTESCNAAELSGSGVKYELVRNNKFERLCYIGMVFILYVKPGKERGTIEVF